MTQQNLYMKKITALLAVLLLVLSGRAQQDSSRIDIGWLSLDKGLTQTISIKGEDLEKMPFVNLSDAIAAWLYGAYTTPSMLAYVVDGNPVTDVNIYPIFDIEEVEFVENAAAGAAYGAGQQELVVITTKRGKGKCGLRAAGQAGLVNSNGNGVSTYTNVYHQYYLGGYKNFDKVSYGVSADWIRDVVPVASGSGNEVTTPFELRRWRLSGYLVWRLAKGNTIELRMGYAPQRIDQSVDSATNPWSYETTRRQSGHLLEPSLFWRSELLPGLTSELRVVYLGSTSTVSFRDLDTTLGSYYQNVAQDYGYLTEARVSQMLVRERLGYTLPAGKWRFQPNLNFSGDRIDEKSAYAYSNVVSTGSGIQQVAGPVPGPLQELKSNVLFLTPAVDIGLGRALDLQLGVQMNVNHGRDTGSRNTFPFASLGVDVLHFGHSTGGSSLKFFGSYAQRTQVFVDDYSLTDLSGGGAAYSLAAVNRPRYTYEFFGAGNGITTDTIISQNVPIRYPSVFWTWEAGVSYVTAGERLRLGYTFERRNFMTGSQAAFIAQNPASSVAIVPEWRSSLHHIDIRFAVVSQKECTWETGLNATALKVQEYLVWLINGSTASLFTIQEPSAGDVYPSHLSWTGGWVNRLRVGGFRAGIDLLYHFGESVYDPNTGVISKINSLLVPNIYAGYRWKLAKAREVELFVASRGLVRNKSNDLLDERRYYTLGGNFTL